MNLLLVEDDEALALGIEFSLKKEGFNINRVGSIEDAKKTIFNEEYDLMLLDITLPDGNGYDLCKYIREQSDVPIIFLTALDDEVNVVLGLEIGGDDYITKPFGVKELVARIRVVLKRIPKKEDKIILKSGNVELNTKTTKVKKDSNEVQLTAQEYRLLCIFLENSLRVLERNMIIDKLLEGAGEYLDSNTLSVYIRRLREKLEDDFSNPEYIVTQRGIGYKWNKKVYKE